MILDLLFLHQKFFLIHLLLFLLLGSGIYFTIRTGFVQIRKFGEGTVQSVTGTGADARIMIAFTAYGTREFSLSIAPIVKIET